ncbi:WS/DGAT domain-containing protein [Mycobacterium vicinigordonae]|uniref:DUF1298 domain-containing protein n=1 Tax=Mycobacterium vicinigordonae TaxID=1719132 RepID=A0A7D6I401_9MYCO|nr:WS/DGAT domain-containing protein [Mycobacterium vicinigordonae]QLL06418.1 DUF1298 domain-containing protein [Mycobacterium vicinigordonae]
MAAVDAQFYWMSAKVPNDEFLLYVFDGEPADLDDVLEQVRRRAADCPDWATRVQDGCAIRYPRWVPAAIGPEWLVRHELTDGSWRGCLNAVSVLADSQLDQCAMPWRLHVFTSVRDIPSLNGPGTVVVLQAAHALGDGRRLSAMTAWLLGRQTLAPQVPRSRSGLRPWRAVHAVQTYRQLVADTEAGLLPMGVGSRPPLATNTRPQGVRSLRTLVRRRSELPCATVTVGALAAVSTALAELIGANAESLAAEVPMAKPGAPLGYNHFGNVAVGLYPYLGRTERMQRIATDLANARLRMAHPAGRAGDRAFATVPAALLRWGVSQFDVDVRPAQVTGNTVVSSVHRGAADLSFGGAPVVFTAGYPSLSPAMGLTHGVHGIGDTIAISVHAAESAVPDVDHYLRLLDAALK